MDKWIYELVTCSLKSERRSHRTICLACLLHFSSVIHNLRKANLSSKLPHLSNTVPQLLSIVRNLHNYKGLRLVFRPKGTHMFLIKRHFKTWLSLFPISQILLVPKWFLGYQAPLEIPLTLSGMVDFNFASEEFIDMFLKVIYFSHERQRERNTQHGFQVTIQPQSQPARSGVNACQTWTGRPQGVNLGPQLNHCFTAKLFM